MPSLSIKKAIKKRIERRQQEYREELTKTTGIYFAPVLEAEKDGFPFLKYLINALILFTAVFGSLGCFITAFELELNIMPLTVTCAVAAAALSFMYFSNKAKIATYLAILGVSIFVSGNYFREVNSGVNSIVNKTLSYIDAKVSLPYLREYNVYYDDEYFAMSLTVCVLALVLMIILNIFISERMDLMAMFFITLPATQAGMFFGFHVSKFYMLCVVTSWVLVAGVRFTNSYNGLTREMVSKASVRKRKHKHSYGFVTDSHNVAAIACVWLAFILAVTGFAFAAVPADDFRVNLPTNIIKESTERPVKNFLSYGFLSLFSSDRVSGSPGQLSNVSQVSYDGNEDLKVTLVNYRVSRVYLRSYIGYRYDGNNLNWTGAVSGNTEPSDIENGELYGYTPALLKKDFENGKTASKSMHKIVVEVTDSALLGDPLNVPYYSVPEAGEYTYPTSGEVRPSDLSDARGPREYTVYTLDSQQDDYSALVDENAKRIEEAAREEAYAYALEVPAANLETIKNFCDAYGIKQGDKDAVEKVVSALESDYEYTLRPGKIPYGEDYVNYFLLANQKGYCQHFATAATLIFRYLGIPARYAEGYVIDREDYYTSESLFDEELSEWIDTPYAADTFVSRVSVKDSSGHAWVEVWKDGIGWVAVEATTAPSADDEPTLLQSFFRATNPLSSATRNITETIQKLDAAKTKRRLVIMFAAALLTALMIYIIRSAVKVIKRHREFSLKNPRRALSARCAHLFELRNYASGKKDENISYGELFGLLESKGLIENGAVFCEEFEKLLFSASDEKAEAFAPLIEKLIFARKKMFGEMRFTQKLKYCFIDVLW
ncbi:MAG: transglutaminase domain-containing protein [Clostridia bacterium]|nr:transglutaminase domain-containing protein [Clostridia bacterium]